MTVDVVEIKLNSIRISQHTDNRHMAKKKMNHPTANFSLILIRRLLLGLSVAWLACSSLTAFASPRQEPAKSNPTPQPDDEPDQTPAAAANPAPQPAAAVQPDVPMARGIVFSDLDGDGKYGDNDAAYAGVKVSNGVDIVLTDASGRYELPIEPDTAIFIIKPSGYRSSLDRNNLPQFYYLHKPDGSPKLKFPGSQPTGPLPQSIDFPLYEQQEPEAFKILLFGDPQPRNHVEVDYIAHDVVSELIGNDSAFGVTLGDIAFDNLDTFETLNQAIAMIGIPWYNVIGNHDINLDGKTRALANETYEATYGPSYYSFDYGQVHFVVLDNIDWLAPNQKVKRWHYKPGFGKQQLDFLKKDLAMIPETQMVVLMMHVPIISVADKGEFFKLIEKRPYCVSISGHTHDHRHLFLGPADGFDGPQKHHHIVNVTVSGSWWSGAKDERGIPHTTMADGAPNGYSIMTFSDDGYKLDFKAAGRPASEQMRVRVANSMDTNQTGNEEIWVNVYNGSEQSTVKMSIDNDGDWMELEKKLVEDPHFVELSKRDEGLEPKLAKPKVSYHLWYGKLPAGILPGAHLIRVQTTDRHGRNYLAHRSIRVTGTPVPTAQPAAGPAPETATGAPAD
jgi:hypothetical protein